VGFREGLEPRAEPPVPQPSGAEPLAGVADRHFAAGEGATLRVERVETSGKKSKLWRVLREMVVPKG